ncbi:phage capsid protein [bacterium]|nr:phage capsid protein [bacterium]
MTHQFSQVPKANIPRSSFDRSHGIKTTFDAGYLIPIYVDEALPGDTFNLKMTAFSRIATLINVPMDNMFMESFFFAVPNRLLWENWQKFNGEQANPGDSTDFVIPTVLNEGTAEGSLADYFGLPIGKQTNPSALPFRAFNLIWNEWFRDQNMQDSVTVDTSDGPDGPSIYNLLRRGKRHDYFTSCLPWPQKGDSIDIPLGVSADIRTAAGTDDNPTVYSDLTSEAEWLGSDAPIVDISDLAGTPDDQYKLYADLTTASSATINQLRQAFQIQKMLERDARGGTRYTEVIKAHFGVSSPDARLQRPEFLGGGSSMVSISAVPQTSATDPVGPDASPQANLSAFGTVSLNNHGFTKSFTEHCTIIGLVNVRADLTYQQGLNRMWSRSTRYDFYWPALAHIGEQAVLNKEIFTTGNPDDDDVFGYQERFAEYRYKPSQITGKFRSEATGTLDSWHLSQDFAETPSLNAAFIEDNPPVDRIIAVQDEPQFLFDGYINLRCARPMPLYGVPGLIDHF